MTVRNLAPLAVGAVVVLVAAVSLRPPPSQVAAPTMTVYKSQSCGCCSKWVDHLVARGFHVQVTNTEALQAIKAEHGVGDHLASCHTALVDGYVIEGHVPGDDILRLLAERPDVVGLAVPGMIVGSPGMEVPGQPARPYQVLTFDERGNTSVFSSR